MGGTRRWRGCSTRARARSTASARTSLSPNPGSSEWLDGRCAGPPGCRLPAAMPVGRMLCIRVSAVLFQAALATPAACCHGLRLWDCRYQFPETSSQPGHTPAHAPRQGFPQETRPGHPAEQVAHRRHHLPLRRPGARVCKRGQAHCHTGGCVTRPCTPVPLLVLTPLAPPLQLPLLICCCSARRVAAASAVRPSPAAAFARACKRECQALSVQLCHCPALQIFGALCSAAGERSARKRRKRKSCGRRRRQPSAEAAPRQPGPQLRLRPLRQQRLRGASSKVSL